jgi:hypothetical protein
MNGNINGELAFRKRNSSCRKQDSGFLGRSQIPKTRGRIRVIGKASAWRDGALSDETRQDASGICGHRGCFGETSAGLQNAKARGGAHSSRQPHPRQVELVTTLSPSVSSSLVSLTNGRDVCISLAEARFGRGASYY